MSLRFRLTLLYTSFMGGVLFLFGAVVFILVSIILLNQIDKTLSQAAGRLISQLKVNSTNQFDARSIAGFQANEDLLFQVWGKNNRLQLARPASLQYPLDDIGRKSDKYVFRTTRSSGLHLRVLSIPVKTHAGVVGVLQVGFNLALIDTTQQVLAMVLLFITVLTMIIVGLAVWFVNGQALSPLKTVTQIATTITRADDLSRRIPLSGQGSDEVGQLIQAFNQTLERLENLFTSQQRFVADVSHELRTPLTVIKGNIGLMHHMDQLDEESLSSIESEVDRLSRLVGDLLLLAQAESGKLPLEYRPVELDTILLEILQQMRMITGERLQLQITEIDQVQVIGDRDRLKQVFLNIIGNAIQYTPAGGRITLELRKIGDRAQIVISDTGIGISSQDLPHIFERFYRGEKSRKRSTANAGFGLGLSIAYWIVVSHHGTIEVDSTAGKGTTFIVWLPLLKSPTLH